MARSLASRKYQITINNPTLHGFTHECVKNILDSFSGIEYWCLCDEIGAEGTPHTHIYVVFKNAVMFNTLQKRFYGAHIEPARGSNQENRDYIRKEGKWQEDEKSETNLLDTFEESGELPPDRESGRKQYEEIYNMLNEGADIESILERFPSAMIHLSKIMAVEDMIRARKYKNTFRQLNVTYIWGKTGVGKTRSVMEKYGYSNIYRVTNYEHPFDLYRGQDVVVFEEFSSSLPIRNMLVYLDGYPDALPARYSDKAACYTKVYILSNIPLEEQYRNVQIESPATWEAFKRRIKDCYEMLPGDADLPWFDDPLGGGVANVE